MYPIIGGSAVLSFKEGVMKRLDTDPALISLAPGGIYDTKVPSGLNEGRGAKFPYIIVGNAVEVPADRLTTTANRVSLTVDIYSNYQGMTEADMIAARVRLLLHHQQRNLQVPGHVVNMVTIEMVQGFEEMDGMKHVQMRISALLQPLPFTVVR